jgi:TIR domain
MTGTDGSAGTTARPGRRWDVALSFAGAQRAYVEQVAAALAARGVRCFYDADEEIDLWGKYLAEELPVIYGEQAAAVVIFVSAEYAALDWTRVERRAALAQAVRERREYVLPARFDDTPLPGLLTDVSYVDLRTKTPQQFAAMIAGKLASLAIIPPPAPGGAGRVPAGRARPGAAAAPQVAERAAVEGQVTYQDFDLLIEPGLPGKAEKLEDCVRDCEPVPCEVFVEDFAGLDSGCCEPLPPAILASLRELHELHDLLHVGRWLLGFLVRPQGPLISHGSSPPRDALTHFVRTPQPDELRVRERRPHEHQARIGPGGRAER